MCHSNENNALWRSFFLSPSLSLSTCIFSPVHNVGQPRRSLSDGTIEKMNCDVYGNECVGIFTILLSVSGKCKPQLEERFCSARPIKHLLLSLLLKLDLSKSCHLTSL